MKIETSIKISILFEDPFWVGVVEREEKRKYSVCKIVFGAEPKDYEVYAYLLSNFHKLKFSTPIKKEAKEEKKINPKRVQRVVSKSIKEKYIGTKAQQALKLQQEENKVERKAKNKREREEKQVRKFELRQEKKRQKHKGK